MKIKTLLSTLSFVLLLFGTQNLFATTIGLADFSGSETIENFESFSHGDLLGTSFVSNGLTYSSGDGHFMIQSASFLFDNLSTGSGLTLNPSSGDALINIDFSSNMNRVGIALSSAGTLDWTVSIFDSNLIFLESITVGQPDEYEAVFVGFERTETIGRLQIDNINNASNGYYTFIDDVRYEQTSPVPEPATMLLFGIGLLGIAGVNRKKS